MNAYIKIEYITSHFFLVACMYLISHLNEEKERTICFQDYNNSEIRSFIKKTKK